MTENDKKSEIYICVGCGVSIKGTLKAFSDGMGYGMRHVCKMEIVMCQDCMKEIGHAAIDL